MSAPDLSSAEVLGNPGDFVPHPDDVSGADLLNRIRANTRFDATRIIVASADGTWSTHLNEEVDFVLNKPVSYVQLRTLASRLLKSITSE